MSIKTKLIIIFLVLSVIPSMTVGYLSFSVAENSLKSASLTQDQVLNSFYVSEVTSSLKTSIFAWVGLILLVTLITAYFLAKSISDPLEKLIKAAKKVSEGNLDIDLHVDSTSESDEVNQLNRVFMSMTSELKKYYSQLEEKIKDKTQEFEKSKHQRKNILDYLKLEKNRVEKEVKNTKKFQQAVEVSTDGIVITDSDSKIIYANSAWEKLNGYSFREVRGLDPNILKSPRTPKEVFEKMKRTLRLGNVFISEEIVNRRKDNSEYNAQLSVVPIVEEGRIISYVGILQDITKRKEIDRMKTEFISLASHQLSTPLSAMKWFLDMLVNDEAGKLNREQKEITKNIKGANEMMVDLVNSLLNISRIESGRIIIEPTPTDIKSLLQIVTTDLKNKLENKKQSLKVEVDHSLPKINLDPNLMRHVFTNLLTNAIKYTPKSGSIGVTIKKGKEFVLCEVRDNGIGIPEEEQERVFQKFFRAKNIIKIETEGNGLGLYLVKAIVESSGGKIWFKSTPNKGSTFWFTLPLKGLKPKKGEVKLDSQFRGV